MINLNYIKNTINNKTKRIYPILKSKNRLNYNFIRCLYLLKFLNFVYHKILQHNKCFSITL